MGVFKWFVMDVGGGCVDGIVGEGNLVLVCVLIWVYQVVR